MAAALIYVFKYTQPGQWPSTGSAWEEDIVSESDVIVLVVNKVALYKYNP